eukprot:4001428-Amphidinium_carterae.2
MVSAARRAINRHNIKGWFVSSRREHDKQHPTNVDVDTQGIRKTRNNRNIDIKRVHDGYSCA